MKVLGTLTNDVRVNANWERSKVRQHPTRVFRFAQMIRNAIAFVFNCRRREECLTGVEERSNERDPLLGEGISGFLNPFERIDYVR
jgi:hypothetical protein